MMYILCFFYTLKIRKSSKPSNYSSRFFLYFLKVSCKDGLGKVQSSWYKASGSPTLYSYGGTSSTKRLGISKPYFSLKCLACSTVTFWNLSNAHQNQSGLPSIRSSMVLNLAPLPYQNLTRGYSLIDAICWDLT